MVIELRTKLNNYIENEQFIGILPYKDIRDNEILMRRYVGIGTLWRTNPTGVYNCHGLTFASKRTRVFTNSTIRMILMEDGYKNININDVFPGDIILYVTQYGDITHSGFVLLVNKINDFSFPVPMILSKWGNGSEVYHAYNNCPYYSSEIKIEFHRMDG